MPIEEPTREQWRAVPVNTLRAFALAASERTSTRAVADQIGIGRTTLRHFAYGDSTPHPRIRRLLALWYLRVTHGVEVDSDVCEALLAGLPGDRRSEAVEELQDFVRELHAKHGGLRPG